MSWTHLRQFDEKALRYFMVACEQQSVRAAAERLRIAPSAVGKKIKELEEDLGIPLLTRTAKGTLPTAMGRVLLDYLQARHSQDANIISHLLELTRLDRGELRVAVGEGFLADFMLSALDRFWKKHPHIRLTLQVFNTEQILEGLESGKVDIAIAFYPPDMNFENVHCAFERTMHFSCFMPISWDFPDGDTTSISELRKLPCALMTREFSVRRLIDAAERAAAIRLDVAMETNSLHALRYAISNQSCMTIMPDFVLQSDVQAKTTRRIALCDPILNGISVRVLISRAGSNDPSISALLQTMKLHMALLRGEESVMPL